MEKHQKNKSDNLHLVESDIKNKSCDDGVRTWSTAVQILLPVAALAFLWGRKGLLSNIFLQLDKNCISVLCPSFSKRQNLLKWASGRLPPTWSSHTNTLPGGIAEFWKDGSLLCTLINSAIPGACPNPYRHWRQSPSHGQALAYKYLGIAPVFTENEFKECVLTVKNEQLLLNYLIEVQQAITKINLQDIKFSSRYVARGMGLVVGEQHRKTSFYIYSNSKTTVSKHDVVVYIRGPYNNNCSVTIPSYYASRKSLYDKKFDYQSKAQKSFFRALSLDIGSFINICQRQNNKDDIAVKVISEKDRIKVSFIPPNTGLYEISIITNGFHLVGSPFTVNIVENSKGSIDVFNEDIKFICKKNRFKNARRRIVSRIVDFIGEKVSYETLINQSSNMSDNKPKFLITYVSENTLESLNSNNESDGKMENTDTNNYTNILLSIDNNKNYDITTSPICSDHIESEVDTDSCATSKAPSGNFVKNSSPGNSKTAVEIAGNNFDYLVDNYILDSQNNIEENLNSLDSLLSFTNEKDKNNNKQFLNSENIILENKLGLNKNYNKDNNLKNIKKVINETFEDLHIVNNEITKKSNKIKNGNSPYNTIKSTLFTPNKKRYMGNTNFSDRFNYWENRKDVNPINQKQFLCKIENEDTKYGNISLKYELLKSSNEEYLNNINFQNSMNYWKGRADTNENQINIHKPQYFTRRSLPDLFASPIKKSNNNNTSTDFSSYPNFEKSQQYWRNLSSRAECNCNLRNTSYCLENCYKNNLNRTKQQSRRSLPDLLSEFKERERLSQANYRNLTFSVDFLKSQDALKYKAKFRECKQFWEKISSNNSLETGEYLKSLSEYNLSDEGFDSGFYSSLQDIYTKCGSISSMYYTSHGSVDNLTCKEEYNKKREYWETLSGKEMTNLSLEEEENYQFEFLKNAESGKSTPSKEIAATYDSNLTDDLKQINDHINTKYRFERARSFFKKLESTLH